jgi:phosphoglycerate kinase
MNDAANSTQKGDPPRAFASIDELDCRGRRVLLLVDPEFAFELAAAPDPVVAPAPGALGAKPEPAPEKSSSSLRRLLDLGARVILATHLSKESARATGIDSIDTLAARLSEKLQLEVLLPDECAGDAVTRVVQDLRKGQICLLPDLALERGELHNDETFARALAGQADAYVGEALSVAHLDYASVVRVPRLLSQKALGYAAQRELAGMGQLMAAPRGTLTGIIGGDSFAEKSALLSEWLPRFGSLYVGGRAALTLLAAKGSTTATEGVETDRMAQARSFLARARDLGVEVKLPVDLHMLWAGDRTPQAVSPRALPAGARVIDIGPGTRAMLLEAVAKASDVWWWGALGDLELGEGERATRALVEASSASSARATLMGAELCRVARQLPADLLVRVAPLLVSSSAAKMLLAKRKLPGLEALRLRH